MSDLIKSDFYLPYNPKLKLRASELRKNMTLAEKELWDLVLRKLPVRFNRQKIIDNFIVDFYCAKLKLVIEVDGDSHFSEEGIAYDQERTAILESYGLRVLRFTNQQVLEDLEIARKQILSLFENPPNPL